MVNGVYFDRIGKHFLKNIYTRPKGKIRLAVLQRDLADCMSAQVPLRVLDVGGGSGHMALWALQQGHEVTLLDHSAQLLDCARELATRSGLMARLTVLEADALSLDTLLAGRVYDVVFCHALLEWVADGEALIAQCVERLRRGGVLSLMHYNRRALEFTQHVFGNFDYLATGLVNKHAAKLTPDYPRYPEVVERWLGATGLRVIKRSGVRCFYDYMKPRDRERNNFADILAHELVLSEQADFLPVARYLHELWRKY